MGAPARPASAQWIWQPVDGPANTFICFRKTLSLSTVPSAALVKIAVDSKYWLYVNGQLVIREGGLKRGPNPSDTYYDEVDLRPYLTTGSNTIAALVWFFGKDGFSHKNSGRGGFYVQSISSGFSLMSDNSWKLLVHPGFVTGDGSQPNYRLPESNIYFDARLDVPAWMNSGFDDSAWQASSIKGAESVAPWNKLAKRPIPQWKDYGLKDYTNSSPGRGNGNVVACKLPYNAQVNPYLKVDAPAGMKISISCDNYKGGGEPNIRGEYTTKAGVQEFEMPAWINGHEIWYTIPSGVTILALKYRETGYQTAFGGSFSCDNMRLNTLWSKSLRTLYVNMRDTYMDCPDRERAQWMADGAMMINEAFYALGPDAIPLGAKAFKELAAWKRSDGVVYFPVPSGNWTQELPIQVLNSIGWFGLYSYYWQSGDADTVRTVLPVFREYLIKNYSMGIDGMVQHRKGDWDFYDWGTNSDGRVLDNTWYYLALKSTLKLGEAIGDTASSSDIKSRMAGMEANFDSILWNSNDNAYGSPDDRGNAMAVLSGLAKPERYPAIRTLLKNTYNASPHMEKFVLEALYQLGSPEIAVQRMQTRFGGMISSPLSTVWESWSLGGVNTSNHGWAGGSIPLLGQYAAGVYADTAGYSTFHVYPQLGPLTQVSTVVPSVKGSIPVSHSRTAGTFTTSVTVPAGTQCTLGVPYFAAKLRRITVNGVLFYDNDVVVGTVPGATFLVRDEAFHKLSLAPGAWKIYCEADAVTGEQTTSE